LKLRPAKLKQGFATEATAEEQDSRRLFHREQGQGSPELAARALNVARATNE
jgi:hypothetical protein